MYTLDEWMGKDKNNKNIARVYANTREGYEFQRNKKKRKSAVV